VFDRLTAVGVDLDEVFETLESEGVTKFISAWQDLLNHLDAGLAQARTAVSADRG